MKELVPICSEIFLECFNDNYLNGKQFDSSLKSSYIKLIPKSGEDPTAIGNWRPITIIQLISSTVKLFTFCAPFLQEQRTDWKLHF